MSTPPDELERTLESYEKRASEVDLEQARRLTEEVTNIHNTKQDELDRHFRSSNREEFGSPLTTALEKVKKGQKRRTPGSSSVPPVPTISIQEEENEPIEMSSQALDSKDAPRRPRLDRKSVSVSIREQLRAQQTIENEDISASSANTLESGIALDRRRSSAKGHRMSTPSQRFSRLSLAVPDRQIRLGHADSQSEVDFIDCMSWQDLSSASQLEENITQEFFSHEWNENDITEEEGTTEEQSLSASERKSRRKKERKLKKNIDVTAYHEVVDETEPLITNLGVRQKTRGDFLVSGRATAPRNKERVDIETGFLYYPPDQEAPLELKTGGVGPRYLDDEGLYVGRPPFVVPANVRRLENRLIQQTELDIPRQNVLTTQPEAVRLTYDGDERLKSQRTKSIQDWFGEDGKLAMEPNPLRNVPMRYPAWDDQLNPMPEAFQTNYLPPLTPEATRHLLAGEDQSDHATFSRLTSGSVRLRRQSGIGVLDAETSQQLLEVRLHKLQFDFHPLFSWEHVYAQNLRGVVSAYELQVSRDQVNACIQRIRALQRALEQLKEKRKTFQSPEGAEITVELDTRIDEYEQEISLMRRSRNHAEAVERGLLTSALRTWKRIKTIRKEAGCTNATVRLRIIQESTDKVQERQDWNRELDEQVAEARVQHAKITERLQETYEKELASHKDLRKKRLDALKRQRRRESGHDLGDENVPDLERSDAQLLAKGRIGRAPEPPAAFNAALVREQMEIEMQQNRRGPGEPKVSIQLIDSETITPDSLCPKDEITRRQNVGKCIYFVKLYFNRKFVEATKPTSLSQDFSVNFTWNYPMQIRHYPESITAKLFEKSGWSGKLINEFTIQPPTLDQQCSPEWRDATNTTRNSDVPVQHVHFCIPNKQPAKPKESNQSPTNTTVGMNRSVVCEALDGSGERQTILTIHGCMTATSFWSLTGLDTGLLNHPGGGVRSGRSRSAGDTTRAGSAFDSLAALHSALNPAFLHTESDLDVPQRGGASITDMKADPNDPRTAGTLNLNKALTVGHLGMGDFHSEGLERKTPSADAVLRETRAGGVNYFRLDPMLTEFQFCTDADLDESRRFRLLQARQAGVVQFQDLIVPPNADQISADIFKDPAYNRKITRGLHAKGMEAYRVRHQLYLDKMKQEMKQRFHEALRRKTLKEVVVEEEIPNMLFLIPLLKRIVQSRRPLKPTHEQRRRIAPQNVRDSGLEIRITVYSAQNLPTRQRNSNKAFKEDPIRPFAQIRFRNQSCTTITSEGSNPSWNAELSLPFNLGSNAPPLEAISDPVIINVYDEVIMESSDAYDKDSKAVHRTEHWLLGGLEIPFSTIYLNSRVDGKLRLLVPLVLQGYDVPDSGKSSSRSMLQLFMTLEPSVKPPEPMLTTIMSTEPPEVMALISDWRTRAENSKFFHSRQFSPLVMNTDCKEVLMTRYLSPLNPPEELIPGSETGLTREAAMKRLARYVSLIPYVSDAAFFPGLADVWCRCDQLLHVLSGDEEEHATLLACYFLYLNHLSQESNESLGTDTLNGGNSHAYSVYLCLGEAVPEGRTVYVLTQNKTNRKSMTGAGWSLWNPSTGESSPVNNVNGPMRGIHGLASTHNVWMNVQPKHQPWELEWDLSSRSDWLPLFHTSTNHKRRRPKSAAVDTVISKDPSLPVLSTVQPAVLCYDGLSDQEVSGIKFELETALRDALMDWRKTQITRLNYEYIPELTKILENLESHNGQRYDGLTSTLDRISAKYHVYGFPMNFPYMDTATIVERVRSKGIHELHGQDLCFGRTSTAKDSAELGKFAASSMSIQFALAVYVKAYKGPVLSIWVYLAALWRRSTS